MRAAASLFLLTFCFNTFADDLKTYTYRVRLPQLGRSCQEEARLLGERFANSTQLEVVKSECVGTTEIPEGKKRFPLSILVVTYNAKSPATFYTIGLVAEGFNAETGDLEALYPTYEGCLADLQPQWNAYAANTGLIPISYDCEAREVAGYEPNYRLKIEGAGKPKAMLARFEGYRNFDALAQAEIRGMFQSAGAAVVKEMNPFLFYYAAAPISISKQHFALFANAAECQVQIGDAAVILTGLGATANVIRCTAADHNGFVNLQSVSNTHVVASDDFGFNSPVYFSFSECLQDKPRAVKEARGGALGGVCVHDVATSEERYKLHIFSKY